MRQKKSTTPTVMDRSTAGAAAAALCRAYCTTDTIRKFSECTDG